MDNKPVNMQKKLEEIEFMEKAIDKFHQAWDDFSSAVDATEELQWFDYFNDNYPFDKDFIEMEYAVLNWCASMKKQLDYERKPNPTFFDRVTRIFDEDIHPDFTLEPLDENTYKLTYIFYNWTADNIYETFTTDGTPEDFVDRIYKICKELDVKEQENKIIELMKELGKDVNKALAYDVAQQYYIDLTTLSQNLRRALIESTKQ